MVINVCNKKYIIIFFIFFVSCYANSARAANGNLFTNSPVVIDADSFEYIKQDNDRKIIARGNVKAVQDDSVLTASYIEYNYNKQSLLAEKDVKLLEKQGFIIKADKVILTDRLKFGSIYHFTVLLPNKSTLRGEVAKKEDQEINHIQGGYYTSCKICQGKHPIWSISAKEASYNKQDGSITYKNAFFNVYGTPVFYTPYMFHYTKKSARKSGVLIPEYGGSSYLGASLKVPYYINISPNQDATITPMITAKQGASLDGQYRYLTSLGELNNEASIASADNYRTSSNQKAMPHNLRYDFSLDSNLEVSKTHFVGWDINRTSDKSYRRDYNRGKEDSLTSKIYNKSYQNNGFYEMQALSFQNLRPETSTDANVMNQTPMVLPLFESKHKLLGLKDGSDFSLETSMLKIHRYEGVNSNRLSIKNIWSKNALSDNGHDFNFFTSLRNDIYHYDEQKTRDPSSYSTSRHIPEAGIKWSYPLAKKIENGNLIIAPMASFTVTPYSKYNNNIYNEDSSSRTTINDSNLLSSSKYNGIDMVENGSRAGYGIKSDVYYNNNINGNFLFGQMYYHKPQENLLNGQADPRFSDYIGRFKFNFQDNVIISYQYKLDYQNFVNKSNEVAAMLKYKKAYLLNELIYYRDNVTMNGVKNRRELFSEIGIQDFDNFSASLYSRRNLSTRKDNPSMGTEANGFISIGGKLKYIQDCVEYSANVAKDFTHNQDKKKNTIWWFGISLKNIS